MRAFLLELRAAFGIDELRGGFGEITERIDVRGLALGLDENRPTCAETAQRIVEPCGDRNQLGRSRRIEVRPAEFCGALKRAVLVEDDAFTYERRPRQEIGEALRAMAIFGQVHHDLALNRRGAADSAGAGTPRRRRPGRAWRPRPPRDDLGARWRRRRSRDAAPDPPQRQGCR